MVKEAKLDILASPPLLTLLYPCQQHRKWNKDGGGALYSREGRNFPEMSQLESSKEDCEKSGHRREGKIPEVF